MRLPQRIGESDLRADAVEHHLSEPGPGEPGGVRRPALGIHASATGRAVSAWTGDSALSVRQPPVVSC